MTMPWKSYLMWEYPHVTSRVDGMTLFDRYEVIMDGFIRPQIEIMARFGTKQADKVHYEVGMRLAEPLAYEMACVSHERHDPCEKPVMAWERIPDLVLEALSEHPDKEQIKECRRACESILNATHGWKRQRPENSEVYRTIYALDNLLVKWDLTEKFPLRFYAEAPEYIRLYEIDTDKLTQDVRRKPRSFLRRMP